MRTTPNRHALRAIRAAIWRSIVPASQAVQRQTYGLRVVRGSAY